MQAEPKFGKERLNDFLVDKTFINLNHGSYGYTPKIVLAHKQKLLEQMEFNTEAWFRRDLEVLINDTRSFIAKKVNAPKQNIFMAQNATDAFNGLVKSIHWKEDDVILLANTAYSSIRKTIEWLRDYWKIEILNVNFTYEDLQTSESIQLKIQDTVNMYPKKIKLAIFDHISSMPSIVWPIHAIKLFLDEKNIDLFVDGAHAMCQVDIDIMNLDCAAYFSNLHKWAFSPKSATFVYVSNKYLNIIRPAITGNFRGEGIARQYFWTGTRDCTAYICAQKGIQYLQSFGHNAVKNYNENIVMQGAKLMANIWKTSLFSKDEELSTFMVSVIMPTKDLKVAEQILDELFTKHNTYFAVAQFDGKVYCRICGQIYNEIEDYRKTAELFLSLLKTKTQKLSLN